MSVKGSWQRPGEGYAEGWDAIFGKKKPACEYCNDSGLVDEDLPDSGLTVINCPMCRDERED